MRMDDSHGFMECSADLEPPDFACQKHAPPPTDSHLCMKSHLTEPRTNAPPATLEHHKSKFTRLVQFRVPMIMRIKSSKTLGCFQVAAVVVTMVSPCFKLICRLVISFMASLIMHTSYITSCQHPIGQETAAQAIAFAEEMNP